LGLAGSLFPPLLISYFPRFNLNSNYFFRFFNGFAAGIVLAVGYVHSLPDAFDSFGNALTGSSKTQQYAWAGFIGMVGSLLTFAGEEFVHHMVGGHGGEHPFTVDAHLPKTDTEDSVADLRGAKTTYGTSEVQEGAPVHEHSRGTHSYYSELYVLLFGLSFHSVFVGLALGIVSNDWSLFTAIVFHQFFEGLALGARVARANFRKRLHIWLLDLVFGLAAPVGIAIGIGVRTAIASSDYSFSLVNGTFQALSGGILIFVSLVHMMKEEMEREEFQGNTALKWSMYLGFAMGAGAMSIIGIWA